MHEQMDSKRSMVYSAGFPKLSNEAIPRVRKRGGSVQRRTTASGLASEVGGIFGVLKRFCEEASLFECGRAKRAILPLLCETRESPHLGLKQKRDLSMGEVVLLVRREAVSRNNELQQVKRPALEKFQWLDVNSLEAQRRPQSQSLEQEPAPWTLSGMLSTYGPRDLETRSWQPGVYRCGGF